MGVDEGLFIPRDGDTGFNEEGMVFHILSDAVDAEGNALKGFGSECEAVAKDAGGKAKAGAAAGTEHIHTTKGEGAQTSQWMTG